MQSHLTHFYTKLGLTSRASPSGRPRKEQPEPLKIVNATSAVDLFTYAAKLLAVNPPHATDFSQLVRIANLGIVAGKPFDASRFTSDERAEIDAGWAAALQDMLAALNTLGTNVDGWTTFTETMGVYGNYYFKRAVVALMGLGANPAEDAVYPLLTADADGHPGTTTT